MASKTTDSNRQNSKQYTHCKDKFYIFHEINLNFLKIIIMKNRIDKKIISKCIFNTKY